jgi:predicted component of type VI protein secretion system
MKLSLVVAEGVHKGKVIPIPVPEFVIGRDEDCQLRPASPAVSKKHCAITVRGGKVYVKDCGSTNGTFINGEKVEIEIEVNDTDLLRVGPLAFNLKIEKPAPAAATTKSDPNARALGAKTPPPPKPAAPPTDDIESDKIAAFLLGDAADEPAGTAPHIPDGTTAMDIPAMSDPDNPDKKPTDKPKEPPPSTSSAAEAILKKYMRRPRT